MIVALIGLLISYVPALLLYRYLRNLHEDEDHHKDCDKLLVNGILCSIGVALLDLAITIVWNMLGFAENMPLVKEIFDAFVIAALVEETVKHVTAGKMVKKNHDKVSWLDCIAYFGIVGIGFQIIETIVYMIESNIIQILVKGFTMGHPAYGMLMGYFVGKRQKTGKKSYEIFGFLLLVFLHGLYDFSLCDEFTAINDNLVVVPFILIAIDLFILIRMLILIRKERKGTEYTEALHQVEPL